jgi:hypothetical protein
MASPKNDSLTSTKIKTVAVKRRIVEAKAEPEKSKEEVKQIKKSKLAVRIVGRDLRTKERGEAVEERRERTAEAKEEDSATEKKERAEKKSGKSEADYFHRASHRIPEEKADSTHRKNKKKEKHETVSRPVGIYRKISIFFILLTIILLGAALYFFFVSLTVEVTPKTERVSDKLSVTVTNGSAPEQGGINLSNVANIQGSVEQIPVKQKKSYEATGANILGEEIAGRVTIVNHYSEDKTLVATTRLLSPDGKLFRIKDKISIPAGGSTKVDIYTDQPSQDMAISPTTFSIPGLWAGLQDKIYAKSTSSFVYQSNVQKFVQASDIDKAMQDLKALLVKQVNSQFAGNYRGYDKVTVQVDEGSLKASSSVKANQKVSSFDLELSAMVDVVAFQSADIKKLAEARLVSVIPTDEKLVSLNENDIQYNLTDTDFKNGKAALEVPIIGTMALSDTDNAVDKTKLVGLSADQINQYLLSLNKFSDIKLTFTPPFLKKAPSLVDRIKIIIKK